ncbi:MAG: hypothetical protein R2822_14945 [Spirosomataceae bacterium]
MIKVGIVGAAGYTGGELLRILINHPKPKWCGLIQKAKQESPFIIPIPICWAKLIWYFRVKK